MIKVHVIHTGKVCVDIGVPLKQKNPFAITGFFRGEKNRVWLPVSVYLIEHPKGNILIDTGWGDKRANKVVKRRFGLLPISYGEVSTNELIHNQLKKMNCKITDIKYVFLSHLDMDHAEGIELVKEAENIMVSQEELMESQKVKNLYRYNNKLWKNSNLKHFKFQETGVGPVGRSFDVFGDKSVELVSTPGHSKGLFTTLIQGQEDFIAIIGDTGYMERSWNNIHLPGLTVNKNLARKSLKWINEISGFNNCKGIFATHDPEVEEQIIKL